MNILEKNGIFPRSQLLTGRTNQFATNVPRFLRLLYELPRSYPRNAAEWHPWIGRTPGCSFLLFPEEVEDGVLFPDRELIDSFCDADLPLDFMEVLVPNGLRFDLISGTKGGWYGWDQIVRELSLKGGERIGFCRLDFKTVYVEIICYDTVWRKRLQKVEIIQSKSWEPRALSEKLLSWGVKYSSLKQRADYYVALMEILKSHTICVQVMEHLDTKLYKAGKTMRLQTIKKDDNEEIVRLKGENERLKEQIEKLLRQNNDLEMSTRKIVLSESLNMEQDHLKQLAERYRENGIPIIFLVNLLMLGGSEGIMFDELLEVCETYYEMNSEQVKQLIDAFPFFRCVEGRYMLDGPLHRMVLLKQMDVKDEIFGLMEKENYQAIEEMAKSFLQNPSTAGKSIEEAQHFWLCASFASLQANNRHQAEVCWDLFMQLCQEGKYLSEDVFRIALKLSFILETDEDFFEHTGSNNMLIKLQVQTDDVRVYVLYHDLRNRRGNTTKLKIRFLEVIDRYRHDLQLGKLEYQALHDCYLEVMEMSL